MPRRRRAFATIEIFIVSPVILAIGIGATYLLRWLFTTTHWTTWIPTLLLGIPFLVVYGLIVPMIISGEARERIRNRNTAAK